MNWHLISYADETFAKQQRFLHQMHKEEFVHHPFTREDLVQTNFYQENKKILDQKTGAGYWLWKPYYILEVLKSAEENDFVIYADCGDMFSKGLIGYVESILEDQDISLLLTTSLKNRFVTKRDCFIRMGCDDTAYHESNHLEAGFQIWRVCDKSIKAIEEYLECCKDEISINNDPSTLGEELPGFLEHRNDQSILTNLAIKNGYTVGGPEYRNFVECNYIYWYQRGDAGYGREIDYFLNEIKEEWECTVS